MSSSERTPIIRGIRTSTRYLNGRVCAKITFLAEFIMRKNGLLKHYAVVYLVKPICLLCRTQGMMQVSEQRVAESHLGLSKRLATLMENQSSPDECQELKCASSKMSIKKPDRIVFRSH